MVDDFPLPDGATPPVQPPTPGRIVMVCLPVSAELKAACAGQVRPGVVVRAIDATRANVQVFLDGPNDTIGGHLASPTMWLGTVDYAPADFNAPRTWHWPPRVGG